MRRTRLVLAMVAASLTLSACDFDVYQLPLPGDFLKLPPNMDNNAYRTAIIPIAARICEHAERILDEKDPPSVVLDEIIAIPICFLGIFALMEFNGPSQPTLIAITEIPNWGFWALAAFGLFRLFDIWKPGPINTIQKLPNGWGVIMDDVLAGAVVCIILGVTFYQI